MGHPSFDVTFQRIFSDQCEWSSETFGPDAGVKGLIDHIKKKLVEVEESDGDLDEWVDVIILAVDGAWRSGATPCDVERAVRAKQAENRRREWPDWREADPEKAVEHDREEVRDV